MGDMNTAGNALPAWLARGAGFLAFWLILSGFNPADLLVGLLAAAIATWASLRLLPAAPWSLRPVALARFGLRFLGLSIAAGVDVARRAFHPRLPLRPGFVVYRPHLPPGIMRSAFCTETSLIPGTLPAGADENGGLVIHCLDVTQPVAAQLTVEEQLFARALGVREHNG